MIAPGAEHRAGRADELGLERQVELLGQNHGAEPPPGTNALSSPPSRMPPQYSVAVDQVAERGGAVDDLEHAGPLDVAGHGDHARARRRLGADRRVTRPAPLRSSHGRLASVSTLLTIVGWP